METIEKEIRPQAEREESRIEKLAKRTKREVNNLKPYFKEFIEWVVAEQPDVVIFLDNGARVLGTPIIKYLNQLNLPKIPEFKFYNDDDLKRRYLDKAINRDYAESEFGHLKGKKVLFFDEIFADGIGLGAIQNIRKRLNNYDTFYFALSEEHHSNLFLPRKLHEKFETNNAKISVAEHFHNFQGMRDAERLILPNRDFGAYNLMELSKLYVGDAKVAGKTVTAHLDRRPGKAFDKMSYEELKENRHIFSMRDGKQNDETIEIYKAVAEVKKEISRVLNSLEINIQQESKPRQSSVKKYRERKPPTDENIINDWARRRGDKY